MNLKEKFYSGVLLFFLSALIAVYIFMASDPLYATMPMIKLEFSSNDADFFAIMKEYNYSPEWLESMIYLDFGFLISFTAMFYFSLKYLMASGKISRRSFLGLFCLVPGMLDMAENVLMLQIIDHGGLQENFRHFVTIVWLKWILVIPFVILSIVAIRHLLMRMFHRQNKSDGSAVNH